MCRWFISEMDQRARELAAKTSMGVEIIDFCIPQNLENRELIEKRKNELRGLNLSLHAPYCEIFPSAIDPMVRAVAMHRLLQAAMICAEMGIDRMIVHSGFAPQMYYPEWFVPRSVEFWREFLPQLPTNLNIFVENVLEAQPEHVIAVCDGVNDPRLRLCLDVGHANAYSSIDVEQWIRAMGSRIGHVHLHNNHGEKDTHSSLETGNMDIQKILVLLKEFAPDAAICVESMDAAGCVRFLENGGMLDAAKL